MRHFDGENLEQISRYVDYLRVLGTPHTPIQHAHYIGTLARIVKVSGDMLSANYETARVDVWGLYETGE
jgi:hypothetical protein